MKAAALFSLAAVVLSCVSATAWDGGGSFKSLNLYQDASVATGQRSSHFSANRLRLTLDHRFDEQGDLECAVENLTLYRNNPGAAESRPAAVNRRFDLEKDWRRDRQLYTLVQIDRLNLRLTVGRTDLTVGRQAIGFGRMALFSPLDNIAPFPPDALDSSVRPGVDALRWAYFAPFGGELQFITVAGDRREHNSFIGTLATRMATVDLLAIGGRLRDRSTFGFGLAGDLGGLGLKGEVVHYEGIRVGLIDGDPRQRFALGALEVWFGSGDLTLLAEYFYNGAGGSRAEDYSRVAQSAVVAEGMTSLLGRHYLLVSPGYQLHPLLTGQMLLIWNLLDRSAVLRPMFDWSLAENLSLQLFWTFTSGEKPKPTTIPGVMALRSEFGGVGDSGGLFLQYFF